MKKIISIVTIIALVALIFAFAACGNNGANNNTTTSNSSTTNMLTTLKDEGSSMLEDMSSALNGIGDDLTAEGNVTDNQSSTGLFEDMTSDTSTSTTDTTVAAE